MRPRYPRQLPGRFTPIQAMAFLATLGLGLAFPVLSVAGLQVPALAVGAALLALLSCLLGSAAPSQDLVRGLSAGLVALAALLLLGPAVQAALRAKAVLADPSIINIMEGAQALRVWLTAHGRTIYTDLTHHPYLVTVYAPLFYLAAAPLALLGLAPLAAGRLVSLGSAVAMILAAGHWVKLRTGSAAAGCLLVLGLCGWRYGFEYAALCRVDFFAWALFFMGAVLFLEAIQAGAIIRRRRFFLAAALIFVLAAFAKQQMALYAVGLSLWVPLARRDLTKDGLLWFALPAVLAGLVLLGVFQLASGGAFWLDAIAYPKRMSADPVGNTEAAMLARLLDFYRHNTAFTLLWAGHLGYAALRRRFSPLDLSLVLNLPILALSLRWHGADANYFIGPVGLMACGLAESLADLWSRGLTRAVAVAALAALTAAGPVRPGQWFEAPAKRPVDPALAALPAVVRQASGNVLVESETGYLALDPRASYFDAIELGSFARYGLWDPAQSGLFADVAARRFSRIIDGSDFTPPELRRLIETRYATTLTVGRVRVYAPRDADASAAIAGPQAVVTADPGLTVTVRLENAAPPPGEDCLAPDNVPEARVVVEVQSEKPLRAVSVLFFPRINQAEGNGLELSGRLGDGPETGLYALPGPGGEAWTPIGELRQEARLEGQGYRAELTFTLRRKAQLWLSPADPMRVYAAFAAEAGQ